MNPADAIALLEAINAAAEADMLAGNPCEGAHHRAIERKLKELRAERELADVPEEIELRDVSREEAKRQIIEFVTAQPHTDSFDLAVKLRIDFDLAHEICEELVKDGVFAPSAPGAT